MKSVEENIRVITSIGLELVSHFNLSESSWWDNFYTPLEKNIDNLCKKYQGNDEMLKSLDEFYKEIEMFRQYSEYYGYTFFIMKKIF